MRRSDRPCYNGAIGRPARPPDREEGLSMERDFEEGTAADWDVGPEDDRSAAEVETTPKWRGPATPVAPGADRAKPRALPPSQHYAAHMRETSVSAYLYCSMTRVFREVGPD